MTMEHEHKDLAGVGHGKLQALVLRPGSGWKQLGGAVWEHKTGIRIHWSGDLVRLPGGVPENVAHFDGYGNSGLRMLVKINGGNKKRGMMAWALNCIPQNTTMRPKSQREDYD